MNEQTSKALNAAGIELVKFDDSKQRPISTNLGTMDAEKFRKILLEKLGSKTLVYPDVTKALDSARETSKILKNLAEEEGVYRNGKGKIDIEMPPGMEDLTLNANLAAKGREDRFFLTYPDETVSPVSGEMYLLLNQLSPLEAAANARKVIPDYRPRGKKGVSTSVLNGKKENVFNIYQPPSWKNHPDWDKLPDELPPEFDSLVNHLFGEDPEGVEYFHHWNYHAMNSRSFTFLVLCGAPGTGKNRLKLVLRALHGHANSVDGKKSTLTERFNSQLSEATLAWFDELHYDHEMENVMKELQNDSISIERKGVDTTRSTKIHASIVISNNKPRDNYIAFDARKFVPLKITKRRLEESMTSEEIDTLTKKVEDASSKTFDPKFLAQIAKWTKRHGKSNKWPNLEYRGPMFWALAHTSMSRWQKKAVTLMMEHRPRTSSEGWDEKKKAFKWSEIAESAYSHNGDRSLQLPDYTTVKVFFDVFRDADGKKAFHAEEIPKNLLGDFWIRPLKKETKVMTEGEVLDGGRKKIVEKRKSSKDADLL